MISPRDYLDRAHSTRRLVLLATGASFAAAALLLGPGGSGQSMLPTASTANAKESAPQAGRGWIGVQIQPVTTNIAESLGMKEDKGALIAEPLTGGPAAKAGITAGARLLSVDSREAGSMTLFELRRLLSEWTAPTISLHIEREGQGRDVSLSLKDE